MNSKTLANYYIWSIKALVFIIPFLSLWISTSMFFPYITGRNFAFRILVELALVLWLALVVLKKEYRPKMTPMTIAILAFVAIIGLANLLGVDPSGSFWSRLERMEGYMMILHLAAYFLVMTNVFRTKDEWLNFFKAFVGAGIWVGVYGMLQVLGIKEAIQGGGFRIDGTIGNPTYLAAYLTLVIALAIILFANATSKFWKYFYGSTIGFFLMVMFFTVSRGAVLSLVMATPLFLVLYLIFKKPTSAGEFRTRKLVIGLLVAVIVVPATLWLMRNTSLIQSNRALARLTSISFSEHTVRSRVMIWGIGLQAFKERPILGWGQENFIQAFSKYFNPGLYDQEPWFDRPHNIIFEWLVNGGVFGLASYLSLYGVLFYYIWKLGRRKIFTITESILVLVTLVAYFFQNLFVFENFNTYVLFFSIAAFLNRSYEESMPKHSVEDLGDRRSQSYAVLIAGLLIASAVIYFANIKPIAQARGIITALKATVSSGNPLANTLAAFKAAMAKNTFAKGETLEQLARVAGLLLGQGNFPTEAKLPFLRYAVDEIEKYLKDNPKNIRLHLMAANLYQGGRTLDPSYFGKSREHLEIARQLSPTKQQILFLQADNYLLTNEVEKALDVLEEAASLEPTYRDAQVNYATVGIFANRNDVVVKVVEAMNQNRLNNPDLKLHPALFHNFISDLAKLFDVYMRVGQPQNAKALYSYLLKLAPDAKLQGLEAPYQEIVNRLKGQL
ncbi:MAG: O-antigen ligase family protein [bacterium]|nr:O-antigen ligase family protein [bacterium]